KLLTDACDLVSEFAVALELARDASDSVHNSGVIAAGAGTADFCKTFVRQLLCEKHSHMPRQRHAVQALAAKDVVHRDAKMTCGDAQNIADAQPCARRRKAHDLDGPCALVCAVSDVARPIFPGGWIGLRYWRVG